MSYPEVNQGMPSSNEEGRHGDGNADNVGHPKYTRAQSMNVLVDGDQSKKGKKKPVKRWHSVAAMKNNNNSLFSHSVLTAESLEQGFGNLQVEDKGVDIHFDITHSPAEELLRDDEDNGVIRTREYLMVRPSGDSSRTNLKPDMLLPVKEMSERSFSSTSDMRPDEEGLLSQKLTSRTLYVRGIQPDVTDEELHEIFSKYGAIKRIRSQHRTRGFVIISFYDLRCAMTAITQANGILLHGLNLEIRYAIPKGEAAVDEGALVVYHVSEQLSDVALKGVFSAFGEIKAIKQFQQRNTFRTIEYYDERHARAAADAVNFTNVHGRLLCVELASSFLKHRSPSASPGRWEVMNEVLTKMPLDALSPSKTPISPLSPGDAIQQGDISYYVPTVTLPPPVLQVPSGGQRRHGGRDMVRDYDHDQEMDQEDNDDPNGGYYYNQYNNNNKNGYYGQQIPMISQGPPVAIQVHNVGPHGPNRGHQQAPRRNGNYQQKETIMQVNASLPVPSGSNQYSYPGRRKRRVNEDTSQYIINLDSLMNGVDKRCSVMIRNIPNRYTTDLLLDLFNVNHRGRFEFFYLPSDFQSKCNFGFAFLHLTRPEFVVDFYNEFCGRQWPMFNSEKICDVTFSRIQGLYNLIRHFQRSGVMKEGPSCHPRTSNTIPDEWSVSSVWTLNFGELLSISGGFLNIKPDHIIKCTVECYNVYAVDCNACSWGWG